MDISFGTYQDPRQVVNVLNEIFEPGKFNADFVLWMNSNPIGSNVWYGAFDGDRPVGIYGMLPFWLKTNHRIIKGSLCNNVGVVPDYQAKGIFVELGKYATSEEFKNGYKVLLGVPNVQAIRGHKKVGWTRQASLILYRIDNKDYYASLTDFVDSDPTRFYCFNRKQSISHILTNPFWSVWRYSKPGASYIQKKFCDLHVVYKVFDGRCQVMETNHLMNPFLMIGSDTFDIWAFEGSFEANFYERLGARKIFIRDFISYMPEGEELDFNPNTFCFELCDNDVF